MNRAQLINPRLLGVALIAFTLSACSSSNDDPDELPMNPEPMDPMDPGVPVALPATCDAAATSPLANASEAPVFAFASGRAPDFSAGRLLRVSVSETPALSGCGPATLSDIRVATDGSNVYEIGRFMLDTLTKFDIESFAVDYQYSVNGTESNVNPHDVVFVDDSKAYVIRYGSSRIWIINPSATTETDFFLSEIDLSAYDADGAIDMTDAEIVDGKLFVLIQRLQGFSPTLDGYVAVIDTATDTEIATGQGAEGLNGIRLDVRNPGRLFYNEATNDVMVVASGDINGSGEVAARLTGGLLAIDATDYSSELLIDDDTLNSAPSGDASPATQFVLDAMIATADKGYLVTSTSFKNSTLRAFNPSTGVVNPTPLTGLEGIDITTLINGPNGNVWVAVGTDEMGGDAPGIFRLNPSDDSVVGEKILTELVPSRLVFITR